MNIQEIHELIQKGIHITIEKERTNFGNLYVDVLCGDVSGKMFIHQLTDVLVQHGCDLTGVSASVEVEVLEKEEEPRTEEYWIRIEDIEIRGTVESI